MAPYLSSHPPREGPDLSLSFYISHIINFNVSMSHMNQKQVKIISIIYSIQSNKYM